MLTLIQQPNWWTCGPCALAMALGVSLSDVLAAVGHDGRVDGMPVGFNDADLTIASLRLGFATVRLPASPVHGSTMVMIPGWPPISSLLESIEGPKVLVVRSSSGIGLHAVAVEECVPGAIFFDPAFPSPRPIEEVPPIRFVDFFVKLPWAWRA